MTDNSPELYGHIIQLFGNVWVCGMGQTSVEHDCVHVMNRHTYAFELRYDEQTFLESKKRFGDVNRCLSKTVKSARRAPRECRYFAAGHFRDDGFNNYISGIFLCHPLDQKYFLEACQVAAERESGFSLREIKHDQNDILRNWTDFDEGITCSRDEIYDLDASGTTLLYVCGKQDALGIHRSHHRRKLERPWSGD